MDFKSVLKDIKPSTNEKSKIDDISQKIIRYLEKLCSDKNIDAKVSLVGSVAKNTALKGKSDIDIFIAFPLDTNIGYLKEIGLILAHECCDYFDGTYAHHFASHPYVTADIEGFEVDIVPCYQICDGSQLKSAVDRTILHTQFVKNNLSKSQEDEVLLLKRFMAVTGTYGSEFKVGGFAGYLCELLIINYGNFENTIQNVVKWKYGQSIDLKNYGTSNLFDDPLVVIDPTDENRNVAASLRVDKMAEFIQSARNFLASDNKEDYFYPLKKDIDRNKLFNQLKKRDSEFITVSFTIPDIPLDTLHPQLRKTCSALERKLNEEEFNVFKADYWSDEKSICVILLEMASSKLNNVKVNVGPKVFINNACNNFTKKYGMNNCYVKGEYLVHTQMREFSDACDLISYMFTEEHISLIKVGKNLKNTILKTYKFIDVVDIDLNFLDDFLNPGQYINR